MWTALLVANVILVTWDGVPRDDFLDRARFRRFWSRQAAASLVLTRFEVADPSLLSLPAYQSIFAGALTGCANNECGRVAVETFPERLVRELSLPRESVAVFASWEGLAEAVEHVPGTILVDAPRFLLPWQDSRPDVETFERALTHLRAHRPRFLCLALGDADEWAHRGDVGRYHAALARYDEWLDVLLRELAGMGGYGEQTTVIVTTDHGRGAGERWTGHGSLDPQARSIWLLARGPGVKPGSTSRRATHLDLRPTIEALFGLRPARAVLEELAPPGLEPAWRNAP